MPKQSWGDHTPATIRDTIEQLTAIASEIGTALDGTERLKLAEDFRLPNEQGRKDGLLWLQSWADSFRDHVKVLKSQHARKNGVSDSNSTPRKSKGK